MATTDRGGLQVMARLNEIIQIRILKYNPQADEIKEDIGQLMMSHGLNYCGNCHTWESGDDMYEIQVTTKDGILSSLNFSQICKDCFELHVEKDDQVKKLLASIRRESTDEQKE